MSLVNESFDQFLGESFGFETHLATYEVSRSAVTMYVDTEEWQSEKAAYKYVEDWVKGRNQHMQEEVEEDLRSQDVSFKDVIPGKIDYKNSNGYTIKVTALLK